MLSSPDAIKIFFNQCDVFLFSFTRIRSHDTPEYWHRNYTLGSREVILTHDFVLRKERTIYVTDISIICLCFHDSDATSGNESGSRLIFPV